MSTMSPSNRKRTAKEPAIAPNTKVKKTTTTTAYDSAEQNTEEVVLDDLLLSELDDSDLEEAPVQPPSPPPPPKSNKKSKTNSSSKTPSQNNDSTRSSKRTRNTTKLISSDSETEDEGEIQQRKKSKKKKNNDDDFDFATPRKVRVSAPQPSLKIISKVAGEEIERSFSSSRSGVMKSLEMFNFMCHTNFKKVWHPNLNFITGENGSGKSALLSGILIGLGARANVTSRTKSTASLIQKGKDHARTLITLSNYGNLPERKYGEEIVIERTLSKNGSSSYRIRTLEKWRPLKRNELDYVLLSLNIQLDNPVAILNQEVARNFLRSKDPKTKYTLFYEGTLLAKLYNLLDSSKADIEASHRNLDVHKNVIVQMKKVVDQLTQKKKSFENLKNLKDTVASLNIEYYWALVNDEEKKLNGLQKNLQKLIAEVANYEEKVEALISKRTEIENKTMPSVQQTQAVQQQIREKEGELEAKRAELSRTNRMITEAKMKVRGNEPAIRNKRKEIKEANDALERLKSKSVEDGERAMRLYEEKKLELETEKAGIQQTLKTLRQDGDQFKNGADAARDKLNEIQDKHDSLMQQFEGRKRNLEALQNAKANKYAVYGPKMQSLVAKIQANAHRFKQQPRGPMGSHFTVKDPKYAAVIENILGNFVTSFLVDNGEDLAIMRKLVSDTWGREQLRQSGPGSQQPSIQVNKFASQVHNISKGIARIEGYPTLLDLLDVENNDHIVINALCDYQSAEKILLFESYKTAAVIMKDSSKCPRTCKNGHTLDWYRFTPFPNYAANALKKKGDRASFLQTSKTAQIRSLKEHMKEIQGELVIIKPQLEQSKQEEAQLRRQYTQRHTEYENIKRDMAKIQHSLQENEKKKYKAPDIASHVESIKEMEEELEEYVKANEGATNMIEELLPKAAGLEAEKQQIEKEIPTLLKGITSAEEQKEKAQKQMDTINEAIRKLKTRTAEVERKKAPLQNELEKCQKEVDYVTNKAEESGPRLDTPRSADDVKKEFDNVNKQIAQMQKHLGLESKINAELRSRKTELKAKVKEYRPTHKSYVALRTLIESQMDFLFKKRAEISNGLGMTFQSLAAQRGYKGQLMIDHGKQELHFFICPDKSSSSRTTDAMNLQGTQNSQTKKTLIEYSLGLSGGERSYSTICFILSLWQVMECPFYMLDEFDVFMDAFNRKTSQGALIRHAKAFKQNQFFLFTPLDLIEAPSQAEACVLRLFPPERNNMGPVSPATDNEAENVDPSSAPSRSKDTSKAGPSTSSTARNAAMAEKNRLARR